MKLPGSREMAALLKINRMTAVAALDELEAQGWIEKISRIGTFIKSDLPVLLPKRILKDATITTAPSDMHFAYHEKNIIPVPSSDFPSADKLYFNDGFPDVRITPVDELIRAFRSLSKLAVNKRYLMYGGAQGTLLLRETLTNFLCDTRGLTVTKDNILITRGAQMGIYIASSLLLKPGDHIIVGEPGYTGANLTFQQFGAKINRVAVDDKGIDIDSVEKLCSQKKIKMVYVIPHHHNPTTVTLTPERRVRLLELAARHKFAIIEDDYDYDFHYASKPMMPMASLDSKGSVIYIGTLTKTLAPSIRIGFMVAPERFIQTATVLRKSIDTQGDSMMENAIATMYKDGSMTRHIKKSVKLYKERRDHFCRLLEEHLGNHISFKIPDGGMSVWVKFLAANLTDVSKNALKKGLVISDGTEFNSANVYYNATRLGYASLNFKEQERAIEILKEVLSPDLVRSK
jgi:GntR family transcriptional regulator/MocR family aminotransferase